MRLGPFSCSSEVFQVALLRDGELDELTTSRVTDRGPLLHCTVAEWLS